MYSNRPNVNILTAVLKAHGVDTAVVCPGSRNAPLAHNFMVAGFNCYSVTDERCAGFYALGLSLATNKPVAVCVTSGSAVLNLIPALAEAYYRRIPVIAISADRPISRIGQLEGQTIVQRGVFGEFAKTFELPEPYDSSSEAFCGRIANESMLLASKNMPVHINVPISQPLYSFTEPELPTVKIITSENGFESVRSERVIDIAKKFERSRRSMILIGQTPPSERITKSIETLEDKVVVLYEPLSSGNGGIDFESVIGGCKKAEYYPDFVLYLGDTFVSNRIKAFVRAANDAEVWALSPSGEVHDTFDKLTRVITGEPDQVLEQLAGLLSGLQPGPYKQLWDATLANTKIQVAGYCEDTAVREFECLIGEGCDCHVHYANSSAIRYGNKYSRHYNFVNRGVNGIEGSLSTAAGFSLASLCDTYCVIGDLSFFYDCNALWQCNLRGNFRILLLNNGGGKIFRTLRGAADSPALEPYISASHPAYARGICESYGVDYQEASDMDSLRTGLQWLVNGRSSNRPLLLECKF